MFLCRREPRLAELLEEPIIRAVMKSDGVAPGDIEALLANYAHDMRIGEPPGAVGGAVHSIRSGQINRDCASSNALPGSRTSYSPIRA
jgi:hypothetical protein